MAQFGAKRPIFAPTKTTPDGALPTYDYEKVVTVGKLVKADLTVTNASGELYADDALAEKVDMFASGSLALETDDKDGRGTRRYSRRDQGYAVERGHGLRRRRGSSRWPLLLQGHYSRRSPLFQGRVSSACQGHSRQRQRGDKGLLYHVRHERDDLYRVPLQLWRMAHHERVHDGKRVYRVVRYQARQSGRLISARTGGERERLASRFG